MFIPIGDEPNLQGRPVITNLLIGLNVAIFVLISLPLTFQAADPSDPQLYNYARVVAQETGQSLQAIVRHISAYDLFLFKHGFRPAAPTLFSLVAAIFLHAGWMHLLGNMLFLWIYGDNVEIFLGRGRYLLAYLGTGIAATLAHAAFSLDSQLPMVGASGAISGVLGCYFIWFPKNRVRILVALGFFWDVIRVPARLVLGFYLLIENLLPFVFARGQGGVAYGAHLGGFVAGFSFAVVYNRLHERWAVRNVSPDLGEPEIVATSQNHFSEESFGDMVRHGQMHRALHLYTHLSARERTQLDPVDIFTLADLLGQRGYAPAGLAVLQQLIASEPAAPILAATHLRVGQLQLALQRYPAAYQHFLAVLDLDPQSEAAQVARQGLYEIEARSRRPSSHF